MSFDSPSPRTSQLLENFEEAPDDDANWGEIVDSKKKFYETSEEFSSFSTSSGR